MTLLAQAPSSETRWVGRPDPKYVAHRPSVLYWVMASAFWVSQTFLGKNLLKTLMGGQLALPDQTPQDGPIPRFF